MILTCRPATLGTAQSSQVGSPMKVCMTVWRTTWRWLTFTASEVMSKVYRKGAATATTPCTQNTSGLATACCHLALWDHVFSLDGYDMWSEHKWQFLWFKVMTVVMYQSQPKNSHLVQGIPMASALAHFKAQLVVISCQNSQLCQ